MDELIDWIIHLPIYMAQFGNWLTSPISNEIWISPLGIIGASAVAFVSTIVVLKVVHLANVIAG